ncbi:MAG: DNA polymerase III subunit gamma/tau [Verrucomicrobiae bacterium]|nr:DNA polymerase III subunit gamma/tau [Verrucomicrobiae bacterium]
MAQGYQVIARRWRPKQFDEIVGQDHITRTLKNAITSDRIAHAYLFVGPRGTGKTTTARMFAKALNCEGGPSITPDDDSDICKAIMEGSCMDVIEIDGASNNSVEQIRQLREDCQYAPALCPFKIYIIDEVHMLSTGAFNALLKTLEEPPSHVKFIFATTEAHKILPTIVSRCQRFEFRPISDEQICEKLKTIAKAEKISIDDAALKSVARLANGGMRDAQSTLDQLISFCGDKIDEGDVLEVYGLASPDEIHQLATLLAQANYPAILSTVEKLAQNGKDLYRILVDLQSYLREVLIEGIQKGGTTKRLGPPITIESLMRMNDALHRGEAGVKMGLSQTVNFEVTLLRAVEESRTRAIDGLIKELTALAQDAPEASAKKKNS